MFEQIAHLQFDEGMNKELSPTFGLRLIQGDYLPGSLDEGQACKLLPIEQTEFQRIVDIVRIVGDAIGRIDDLDFQHRGRFLVLVTAELLAGEDLARQVETGIIGVTLLEMGYQVERELIVRESSLLF